MGGHRGYRERATQLVDIGPMMVPQSQPAEAIVGSRAGGGRDVWFHHRPLVRRVCLPLIVTVPTGCLMGWKGRLGEQISSRSLLDLVVATSTGSAVSRTALRLPRVAG